jgi:hypothetical protein
VITVSKKTAEQESSSEKKISRRQMLKGAIGMIAPAEPVSLQQGTISGKVGYPWGVVKGAKILVGEKSTFTDSDGRFEITKVPSGKCTITAQPPFPGYESIVQEVIVAAGETRTADFYLDFEKTTVDGHVYDQEGKPIAGAILDGVKCGKNMETTITDEAGYFRFEGASPGNRFVRVNAAGYMGEIRDFPAKKGERTELDFQLTKGTCKIHGTVTNNNGNPLEGELRLQRTSGLILFRTRSNAASGYYEFSVLPGAYDIVVDVADYHAQVRRSSISADTEVNFRLTSFSESPPSADTPPAY